jgi:hypothetical protein
MMTRFFVLIPSREINTVTHEHNRSSPNHRKLEHPTRSSPPNNIPYRILIDFQRSSNLTIRLSSTHTLEYHRFNLIRLNPLSNLPSKPHPSSLSHRDAGSHALPQKVTLELRQGRHQRGELLPLR